MLDEAKISIPDSDLIIFLVDGSEPSGKGDKWIVENMLKDTKIPIVMVLNKTDKAKETVIKENLKTYKDLLPDVDVLEISAKIGTNKEILIEKIFEYLPKGVPFYDEETITEETVRDVVQEIVREKILLNTKEEIPHCVAVLVQKYEETETIDRIYADIFCETKSQKGILIGKGGSLLKKIGMESRIEIEKMVEKKVFLQLNVKVEKDWRKNNSVLKKFGYETE